MLGPNTRAKVEERIARAQPKVEDVKTKVKRGDWTAAEEQPERLQAYLARRQRGLRLRGAEAVQGSTEDFQRSAFLVEGAEVRRAVGLVEVAEPQSATQGSGFLISPRLFITNQHVIRSPAAARSTSVTFDREYDKNLRPVASTTYALDPDAFFLSSSEEDLDFTIVALGPVISGTTPVEELGYCPLASGEDRHALGIPLNVIQHPKGQPKMVTVRNNLLTYRDQFTLLYDTDTEVGSSGAPVFNDEWDVVALHHYGRPFRARTEAVHDHANEGIRISAIVHAVEQARAQLTDTQRALLDDALALGVRRDADARPSPERRRAESPVPPAAVHPSTSLPSTSILSSPPAISAAASGARSLVTELVMATDQQGSVRITVPLEITLTIGGGGVVARPSELGVATPAALPLSEKRAVRRRPQAEAKRLDTNYENRTGFDESFIPGLRVPRPQLTAALKHDIAALRAGEPRAAEGVLLYQHFSLVLSRTKRIALYTATNIDGATYLRVDRETGLVVGAEGETWYRDPRVSETFYLGQDFYSAWSHYFDRGHLTRRTDPTWGDAASAERANADTFHFSNCSPQHFRFNQTAKFWQGLERYVLENGLLALDDDRRRVSVMQGPIFDDENDYWCDDVQIPSAYWKVVVWKGQSGPKAVGLIADQSQLMNETRRFVGTPQDLPGVDVSQWRVAIKTIEQRTGLDFGDVVRSADTIRDEHQPQPGAEAAPLRLRSLADLETSSKPGAFRVS